MENYIKEQPDTALSVLEQFEPTKQWIISFASKVINDVANGRVDVLRVKLLCKTLEEIADKINTGTKEYQRTEAAKYGDKPFMFSGAEFHLTSVKTEYDYQSCSDVVYDRLIKVKKNLDEQIKERQEFLKTIKDHQTLVDEATGEVYTVYGPGKKQTEGVKISIK